MSYTYSVKNTHLQTGGDINIMLLLESLCVKRDFMPLKTCVKLMQRLLSLESNKSHM